MHYADFPREEYDQRCDRVRSLMARDGLDALLITTEPNIRYLSGHFSERWVNKARSVYLVFPLHGDPALIAWSMETELAKTISWVPDIRPIYAPVMDPAFLQASTGAGYTELALSTVVDVFRERGLASGRIALELGYQQRLGMPVLDMEAIKGRLEGARFADAAELLWEARLIKSAREIDYLRDSCRVTGRAFDRWLCGLRLGMTEREIFRLLVVELMSAGADRQGYINVLSDVELGTYGAATDRRLEPGRLMYTDGGCVYRGYWSDYCRLVAAGEPSEAQKRAHSVIRAASRKSMDVVRPGVNIGDVARAAAAYLEGAGLGRSSLGRFGHGIGLDLIEPPSVHVDSTVVLKPGMLLCIEPSIYAPGAGIVIAEENIVVTEDGYELLSAPTPAELPRVAA